MEVHDRIVVVASAIIIPLLFKWFTLHQCATDLTRRVCLRLTGYLPSIPSLGSMFRSLGWDLCNVAIGLFLAAISSNTSTFRSLSAHAGQYELVYASVTSIVFFLCYAVAVKIRYQLLEAAERTGTGSWVLGSILWTVGMLLLLSSLSLLRGIE